MADTGTHMSKQSNKTKFKYTTIAGSSKLNTGTDDESVSLQEAFKKYRKAKQKELRHARLLRKRNELRKKDPVKMAALRQKFVDQCKKYFGYPYARKYWSPDTPEYKSRLFLDCCGLVRQVMRDLANDFGFVIGPWNQAYMYDTLPITVEKEEDMKPGDLVFISATYFNPKSRKQRHNMTHVEVWAGDGPKTIGARWNNGKVQVWDHYKFVAKSYYNETYHLKSIDTWLQGMCLSHCREHRWKKSIYKPTKKSIFSTQQTTTESEDEAAGDDDDNIQDIVVRGSSFCSVSSSQRKVDSSSSLSEAEIPPSEMNSYIQKTSSSDELKSVFPSEEEPKYNDSFEDEIKEIGASFEDDDSKSAKRSSNLVDLDNRGIYLKELLTTKKQQERLVSDNSAISFSLDDIIQPVEDSDEDDFDERSDIDIEDNIIQNEEDNNLGTVSASMSDLALQTDGSGLLDEEKDLVDVAGYTMETKEVFYVDSSERELSASGEEKDKKADEEVNSNQNARPKVRPDENEGRRKSNTLETMYNSYQNQNKQTNENPILSTSGFSRAGSKTSSSTSDYASGSSCGVSSGRMSTQSTVSDASLAESVSSCDSQTCSKGLDPDNPDVADENSGSESGKRNRGKKSPGGLKVTKLPTCSLPANMTPTFYVGGGNGVSLVEGPLTNLGWKRTADKFDERFKLKWVECKSKINYGSFREGDQMVNHLPNSHLLTNKLGLLNSLKEYERVTLSTKGRLPRLRMSDFHPETYKLDEKSDRELFLDVYKEGEIWICKPVGMNQGKGIFLIRTREAINQVLEERDQKKQTPQKPGRPLQNRIVQRYINNPLLLDGRKFDVRAYMLVASTVPFLILYHKGYIRLSCMKYDADDMNLGIHLTNQFVQKKDPNYKEKKEDTAWSMDKFNDYINKEIRPNSHIEFEEDWAYNSFTKQMQKIMIHCFNSVKHKLQARVGFFDLFGLDFMVDTDMKTWLIEMNVNPCLSRKCSAQKEVIPGVIAETLYVSIECFDKTRKHLPLMPLQSLKNFTILYCGTRPNTIIPRQSRSVSPVKDNTADKPRLVPTGAFKRTGSPPRSLVQRASTQSTPLYASNQRKMSEKNDSGTSSNNKEAANSQQMSSAKKAATSVKTLSSAKASLKLENKNEQTEVGKKNGQIAEPAKNAHSKVNTDSAADSKPSEESAQTVAKQEPKPLTVVVDTLSKTTDSLNQATSALGKMSVSHNQIGLTDSLLEEVRLKMTHADPAPVPVKPGSAGKPNSAKSTRERENLERGN